LALLFIFSISRVQNNRLETDSGSITNEAEAISVKNKILLYEKAVDVKTMDGIIVVIKR